MRFLVLVLFLWCSVVQAEPLIIGKTYPIQEENLLDWIKRTLSQLEQSGELKQMQEKWKATARARVEHPQPLALTHTSKPKTWYIDPSFVTDKAIIDHEGRVIAAPGMRVNPFRAITLSKHLLFIDGGSQEQLDWSNRLHARYEGRVKTILVSGNPIDVMQRLQRRVYFDQGGVLSKKFKLEHVPAIVSQEGLRLRVAEVLPE